jgi:hypothetical protein
MGLQKLHCSIFILILHTLSLTALDCPFEPSDTEAMIEQLSSVLPSIVSLQSLELKNFSFSKSSMVKFLQALRACSALRSLLLGDEFPDESAQEITRFFCEGQETESPIRNFHLSECSGYIADLSDISAILNPPQDQTRKSIGSSLQVLELLVGMEDVSSLWKALTLKGSQLQTLILQLDTDTACSWGKLIQCLPQIMRLQELTVTYVWCDASDISSLSLLQAFCGNGSLQKVSIGKKDGDMIFSTMEWRQIQSYCNRNRWACGLLQSTNLMPNDGSTCFVDDAVLSLCPSLFRVVKPSFRMAPSFILVGLLACCKGVGPQHREKRISS